MESILPLLSSYSPYIIAFVVLLLIHEQISYLKRKSCLPGPVLVLPFIGNVIPLLKNPTKFWDKQSALAQSTPLGISTNYFFGKFILYICSTEQSPKVFANVRPDAFHLVVHPFGKKLFAESNLVYQFGQEHKDLRRRVAPNFTPKGLATYSSIQQRIILKHLKSWLLLTKSDQKPIPLRLLCREMNLETSQTVFVGPYLNDEARKIFDIGSSLFNQGGLTLPVDLPGFGFRKARLSVKKLVEILAFCAGESEKKMKNAEEPTCLIDFWMQENLREKAEATEKGVADIDKKFNCTKEELGGHLFDFLFAAQDASTSSLLWAVTFLDSHPHVLERVRSEVEKYWNPLSSELITAEQLREMKYTEAVVKEVLRIRPPATLVPHTVAEDFALTDDYVIPKGTIVFPSLFDACFQGFPNADKFDPDRFMEERQEDKVYKKNFLTFGAGAHQCIGQKYAINHLKLFVAIFTTLIDFKRAREDGCDDIVYVSTIVPKDDCKVFLSQRCKRLPSLA